MKEPGETATEEGGGGGLVVPPLSGLSCLQAENIMAQKARRERLFFIRRLFVRVGELVNVEVKQQLVCKKEDIQIGLK
jgi:hypothetical protein